MKNFKIYAQSEHSVIINITNHNAYTGKPYITVTDKDGVIKTFYQREDFVAYQEFMKEQK